MAASNHIILMRLKQPEHPDATAAQCRSGLDMPGSNLTNAEPKNAPVRDPKQFKLVGWLVGSLVGWLAGWLAGWLFCCVWFNLI